MSGQWLCKERKMRRNESSGQVNKVNFWIQISGIGSRMETVVTMMTVTRVMTVVVVVVVVVKINAEKMKGDQTK